MSGILIGASIAGPTLPTSTVSATDFELSPNTATASINFRNDGEIRDQDGFKQGSWILPEDFAPGDYEIRANSSSPDTPDAGTMDTWLALTSNRQWTESQSGFGNSNKTFTVDIRRSGGPVLATRNVNLVATVDI